MPLDMGDPESAVNRPAFPGATGFLVLGKLRGMRNVSREALKRLKAFGYDYCKARGLPLLADSEEQNGNGEKEEPAEEKDEESAGKGEMDSPIRFGPHEVMYDNCTFIVSSVEDPSDYAHFAFSKMADDKSWPQPRFPLRIMPVQEICCLNPKAVEVAITPLLQNVFAGEEALRFSIIFHGKQHQDSKDMTRQQVEAVVRNIIWSINPNCVQCIKYQDYAVLLEIVDPLLFVGVAKEFNQLGRYNTATIQNGRDLKETMEDSEDEISDDPELSEADNIKRKLRIKKKRRAERAEEEKLKRGKMEDSEEKLKTNDSEVDKDEEELEEDEGDEGEDENVEGN